MSAEITRIPSCDGSHKLAVYKYIPRHPIAVVQIIHGMAEHIGRYHEFAEFLSSKNIAVIGHDHLGHGLTAEDISELGYIADKNGYELLIQDSIAVTEYIANEFSGIPVVLFGHSMGSLIARNYISRSSDKLCGCILSGNVQDMPGITSVLVRFISCITGAKKVNTLLDNLAFGNYCKRIQNKRTNKDWLTRDSAIVDEYIADKCSGFPFTSSAMSDLVTLNCKVSGNKWLKSIPKYLPIQLFSGSEDPCGGYGKGVSRIFQRLQQAGFEKVNLTLYSDDRHEILNELDREQVMNDMLSAIENMISYI